jgi:hypothetical protein
VPFFYAGGGRRLAHQRALGYSQIQRFKDLAITAGNTIYDPEKNRDPTTLDKTVRGRRRQRETEKVSEGERKRGHKPTHTDTNTHRRGPYGEICPTRLIPLTNLHAVDAKENRSLSHTHIYTFSCVYMCVYMNRSLSLAPLHL